MQIPMIIAVTDIAVTDTDCPGAWSDEDIFFPLGYMDENNLPLMVNVNATQTASVAEAVIGLVEQLIIQKNYCM
jgi:hypothetical protein